MTRSAERLTPRRLTAPLLGAISAALDAALAGDGFDGGDFAGLDRVYFQRASDWATVEAMKRKGQAKRRKRRAEQAVQVKPGSGLFCTHPNWAWESCGRQCPDCGGTVIDPGD